MVDPAPKIRCDVRHVQTASLLLLVCVCKHQGWKLSPNDLQAYLYHASGAAGAVVLLCLLGLLYSSREIWLVVALWGGFELQTFTCSVWWIFDPWVIRPGDELCSSGLQWPLGLLGLWATLCVVIALRSRNDPAEP